MGHLGATIGNLKACMKNLEVYIPTQELIWNIGAQMNQSGLYVGDRTTLDISQRKRKTIPAGWNFFWRSQMTPNQYF